MAQAGGTDLLSATEMLNVESAVMANAALTYYTFIEKNLIQFKPIQKAHGVFIRTALGAGAWIL